MTSATGLRAKGVSKSFGTRRVLDALDLDCPAGAVTGVVGRNGSGKSTLLRCFTGQIEPDRGELFLAGTRLPNEPAWRRARRALAWTFQDVSARIGMRVKDMIALAGVLELKGPHAALAEALAPFERQKWSELSFGQRKLAAFGAATARAPSVLLLDEPVAGLSSGYADLVAASLKSQAQSGCTLFVIEHDRNFLSRCADHVAVLHEGKIIFQGTPDSAFRSDLVLEALA